MSYDLRIWEQPSDRPPPATFEDSGRTMLAFEGMRAGVNPRFVALGKQMSARFPTARRDVARDPDAVWLSDPAVEAAGVDRAVWVISVPPDDRVRVAFFVAETATSFGLTVLDEQLGMALLPGGRVLPAEKVELWEGLRREMADEEKDPPVTKADMRKAMATFLRESVQKHGFRHDPSNKRVDVAFTRSTPAGLQTIDLTLDGSVPHLKCKIYCLQRNDLVESIHDAALGPGASTPDTISFNVGAFIGTFNSGLRFAGTREIKEIFALLETKALPAIEASASLTGLNQLMNDPDRFPLDYEYGHPLDPRSLAGLFHSRSPRPLIVAWLVQDSRFDALVSEYREAISNVGRLKAADLDKLLAYLRDRVRPDGEGSTPHVA